MKTLLILILSLFISSCTPKAEIKHRESSDFIYATYSVGEKLKTQENVAPQNLREFDIFYLVASPKWISMDFDQEQSQIYKKYIERNDYISYFNHGLIQKYIDNIHETDGKVLCSFPGQQFIEIASIPERRIKFADMMAQFIKKFNYDGIELCWEQTVNISLHLNFIVEIREALDRLNLKKHLYLITTLQPHYQYTQKQAEDLCKYIDWINLTFYDMEGNSWKGRMKSPNASLQQIKQLIKNWQHFAPQKLCIGLPSYGFHYKNRQPEAITEEDKNFANRGRYCNYIELPELLQKGWYEKWDSISQSSYFISPDNNEFMTLESYRSLDAKLNWIQKNGFKGIFWQEFHCDWIAPAKAGERGKHLIMDYVTKKIKPEFEL